MSQHNYKTTFNGEKINIMMGWDRPLQGFFLYVDFVDPIKEDEYIYDSSYDANLMYCHGYPADIKYFENKLDELGLKVPKEMIEEILHDFKNNIGNRIKLYS